MWNTNTISDVFHPKIPGYFGFLTLYIYISFAVLEFNRIFDTVLSFSNWITKKVMETEKKRQNFFFGSSQTKSIQKWNWACLLFFSQSHQNNNQFCYENVWDFPTNRRKMCGTREFWSTIIAFVVVKVMWITMSLAV